jgi:hypothetical protein
MLRIGVFVVIGAVAELAARASIGEHLDIDSQVWLRVAAFFLGGLLSLVCYRFLVIAVTSFAGAFLLLLGGMGLAARQGELDTIAFASDRPALVTLLWVLLGVIGGVVQYVLETYRLQEKRTRDPAAELIRKLLKLKSTN